MKSLFVIIFLTFSSSISAQFHTHASRSELGVFLGGSYYIGDLNPIAHFRAVQPAAGLVYRYNIHSRLVFRANFTYGNVVGDDALAKEQLQVNRNLSFKSDIFELGAGVEFHYFPFQLGHDRYKGTAYLLAELGMFRMNPKTNLNGEWIFLQPLGTEGQGSSLGSRGRYSMYQMCIPLGFGFKVGLGDWVTLNFEYRIQKTFTDYLDDVGADTYIDQAELAAANGPLAATLSNRSLDQSRFGKRGTSATKDWYAFCGIMLTVKLGKHKICAFQN